jgi:hypothetical protein
MLVLRSEQYLVEDETADLMDARDMLSKQGNPLVFDTVDEAATVLWQFLRPGEARPMDEDN